MVTLKYTYLPSKKSCYLGFSCILNNQSFHYGCAHLTLALAISLILVSPQSLLSESLILTSLLMPLLSESLILEPVLPLHASTISSKGKSYSGGSAALVASTTRLFTPLRRPDARSIFAINCSQTQCRSSSSWNEIHNIKSVNVDLINEIIIIS